jgi:acetyl esterase/lipase
MHSLLKTTTASAALAAALSFSPLALVAQEATTDDAVAPGTAADPAVVGEAMASDGTTADPAATGEAATADTMMAEEGAATEGAATEGKQTEMAADDAAMAPDGDTMTAEAGDGMAMEATVTADAGAVANPPEMPNTDMQAVLDKLAELGAKPIETLSVEEARSQPTPADAVMAVMEDRGIEMPADLAGILTRDITYPGADGTEIAARVYTPPEGEGPFPLIVYFHGGGWVIANIDVYDASARALAAGANAVVVSATYRQAPETLFPAQHEDANAAYEWIVENSGEFNADSDRLAVAGESAGGNLAVNVAIHARDAELIQPDHVLSVYPIANEEMTTPSYEAYADAAPLSRAGMEWFVSHVFAGPSEAADPRVDLIERADLQGLPPVTIINAEIDPLQSEGEILAERLAAAGVEVEQMTYSGVAHEFFGMGAVVPEAQEAVDMATAALRGAFGAAESGAATANATGEEVTEVEATAAEMPDAMATEGEDAMEMEGTTGPMEGEAATQDN